MEVTFVDVDIEGEEAYDSIYVWFLAVEEVDGGGNTSMIET